MLFTRGWRDNISESLIRNQDWDHCSKQSPDQILFWHSCKFTSFCLHPTNLPESWVDDGFALVAGLHWWQSCSATNFARTSSSSSHALEELLSGKVLLKGRLVKSFAKAEIYSMHLQQVYFTRQERDVLKYVGVVEKKRMYTASSNFHNA